MMRTVAKPLMLWFDCTSSFRLPELRTQCEAYFDVVCSTRPDAASQDIERLKPSVLCFDFDYPDQSRLRVMQAVKRKHIGLLLLMLTLEHSEALAVWAFRVRVWNYLVKPISTTELQDNLRALVQIVGSERRFSRAVTLPEQSVPTEIPSSRPDDPQLELMPAVCYIEQHFNERCSAVELAKLCGMTRFNFSRLFHATFGLTFQDYLLRFRVAEACRLLERPSASVTDIGYAVGFNDPSHFARMFKRYTGLLPSEYMSTESRPPAALMHPGVALSGPALLARFGTRRPASTEDEDSAVLEVG